MKRNSAPKHTSSSNTATPTRLGAGCGKRGARRSRNAAGQLSTLTTPSGQTISLAYSHNRPSSLSVNGTLILNQVAYSPFGPPTSWSWGNGSQTVRLYDSDGQLTAIDSAGQQQTYTYHPDGTIASWRNDAANFGLETADITLTPASTSNRLSATSGELTRTYTYDAAGHITSDGNATYNYDAAGHLSSATRAGRTTTYSYNALGQRIKKASNSANIGTTHFVYDHAGHLLGEYDQAGGLIQELVWLGDIPVATLRPGAGGSGGAGGAGAVAVYYIHTDHLDAPVKLTRPADGRVVWRWDHDPYGNGTPNEDPDGDGVALRLNLRFAGQYADAETGLYYNMARYYDPLTGRYTQSDPIGLTGGLNTYGYVGGSPLMQTDPLGLATFMCTKPLHALGGDGLRSGPDIPGNPFYHQYVCVPGADGQMQCGGQDRADGAFGPGKPSKDQFKPDSCEKIEDDNECIEQCILSAINNSQRPPYWLIGGGTTRLGGEAPGIGMNCQQWADYQVRRCIARCQKR